MGNEKLGIDTGGAGSVAYALDCGGGSVAAVVGGDVCHAWPVYCAECVGGGFEAWCVGAGLIGSGIGV